MTWAVLSDTGVPFGEMAARMAVAALMGVLIGWERSLSDKPAGPRTMVMISVGAAAFALIGLDLLEQNLGGPGIRTDPTRVLSYLISGVGFLGAGAILHSKKSISGLTTAAGIWGVAAMGAACGYGLYKIAVLVFVFVAAALWMPWAYRGLTAERNNGNNHNESAL